MEEPRRLSPARRAVFTVITLTLLVVVTLAIGELSVRLTAPQPASWLDVYRRHPTLPLYTLAPHVERLIDTGETRWTVFTDTSGYRIGERDFKTPRPEAAARPVALVLGDSFTFSQGVSNEESFPALLESDGPLRFVNAGVPGYGPVQYRQVLEYELQSRREPPKVVLVATFLGNDVHDCLRNRDLPVHNGVVNDQADLRSVIKRYSHLYRALTRAYHRAVPRHEVSADVIGETFEPAQWAAGGSLHEAADIFDRELKRMAAITEQREIPMIMVLIPARESFEPVPPGTRLDHDLPSKFVRTRLDALHVPYVDLEPPFARHPVNKIYFGHDGHFTPFGHRLVAEAVRPVLDRVVRRSKRTTRYAFPPRLGLAGDARDARLEPSGGRVEVPRSSSSSSAFASVRSAVSNPSTNQP